MKIFLIISGCLFVVALINKFKRHKPKKATLKCSTCKVTNCFDNPIYKKKAQEAWSKLENKT
jgi:hypothetical protein